mgnify:CR=1 FL=1|jgi:hypothetical protein|tara:strand:- start:6807 stop:7709 length:903 start_codon:yes stop_codon:yes gene_type:complete
MNKNLAPIVLFCYNRPKHLQKTIDYLKKNHLAKQSDLFIFSDEAKGLKEKKKVKEVRVLLEKISGFKKVKLIFRKKNFGLQKNIIDGVNRIIKYRKKVIVLEDDLLTSKYFLKFMNESLNLYLLDKDVASIHGYIYPIVKNKQLEDYYFIRGADCWGWATWSRAWKYYEQDTKKLVSEIKKNDLIKDFNFNNTKNYYKMLKNNLKMQKKSWAIQWYASTFLNNMYTLYPKNSFIKNIGLDGSGENTRIKYYLNSKFSKIYRSPKRIEVKENTQAKNKIDNFFKKNEKNLFQKLLSKIFYE